MTLRIQCPSCQRQFKVNDELQGRTVECGACEEQFRVDDEVIVKERERYFPGDNKKHGLEHYARPGRRSADPPVGFATASYNQGASAADVGPPSPQRMIASALGIILLIFFALILLFGSQVDGLLQDVRHDKRILLGSFIAVIGSALILYGGFRRKIETVLLALTLGGIVVGLSVFLPVPEIVETTSTGFPSSEPGPDDPLEPADPDPDPSGPRKLTEAEARQAMGYGPVFDAMKNFPKESVVGLWAPTMKERFKYQIQRYLHRKTNTGERPSFYNRQGGSLIVIEGTQLSLAEVEAVVDRFATVEDVYPNLRVLKIAIDGERLLEPSPELEKKLNDKSHQSFYAHNKAELDHIVIDRVRDAAQRLATVEPIRFRPEIAKKLVTLLEEDNDPEYQEVITRAIAVWSVPGDGAEAAVARVAQRLLIDGSEVPDEMIRFLIERDAPEVIAILEQLWEEDPSSWQPYVVDVGSEAEEFVAENLGIADPGVQRSAATILRKIGTAKSVPALQRALARATANSQTDVQVLLNAALEAIQQRQAPAPTPTNP